MTVLGENDVLVIEDRVKEVVQLRGFVLLGAWRLG